MKQCQKCKEPKEPSEFSKNSKNEDGLNKLCKACYANYYATHKERFKIYNASRRDSMREYHLKRNYGISETRYQELLKKQDNCCAVCLQPETTVHGVSKKINALAVDHCHESNEVRGLLCQNCNSGIGKLQENSLMLRRAADYLDAFNILK